MLAGSHAGNLEKNKKWDFLSPAVAEIPAKLVI